MTTKVAGFEWVPEHGKTLQKVQAAVQAALSLGPYDPSDPMVLEVGHWQIGMLFGDFGSPYR